MSQTTHLASFGLIIVIARSHPSDPILGPSKYRLNLYI